MPGKIHNLTQLKRKVVRRFNARNIFCEFDPSMLLIIAGYTRSGTTFYGDLLSYILRARNIHEPLNSNVVKEIGFFHERESGKTIRKSDEHRKAIYKVFGPTFRGNKNTNHGGLFFYRGRIVKIVRGMFYLDELSKMFPDVKFSVIIRHPCACVFSRIALGWSIPDQGKCVKDIWPKLNAHQKKIINEAGSDHVRLAVSWCLDNFAALSNIHNPCFKFIYYENLVLDTLREVQQVLGFLGKDCNLYEKRTKTEIAIQNKYNNAQYVIFKWKEQLSKDMITDIQQVVKIFELDHLYDAETQLPSKIFS